MGALGDISGDTGEGHWEGCKLEMQVVVAIRLWVPACQKTADSSMPAAASSHATSRGGDTGGGHRVDTGGDTGGGGCLPEDRRQLEARSALVHVAKLGEVAPSQQRLR